METIIEEDERESIQNNKNIKTEEKTENKNKIQILQKANSNDIENRISNNFQAFNRYTEFNESISNVVESYQEENAKDLVSDDEIINQENNNIENKTNEKINNINTNNTNSNTIIEENKLTPKPTLREKLKEYKVIVLGDFGVGKSSLIYRYLNNKFKKDIQEDSTKSENNLKIIQIDENLRIKLNIWDTAGMEKNGKIVKRYYVDSYGALVVFDLTNKQSFDNIKSWINDLKENCPRDIVFCVAANKSDLIEDRKITYEEIKELMQDDLYYEVSSKNGNNVSLAFEQLAYNIIEKQNEEKDNPDKVLRGVEGRKTTDLKNFDENDLKKKKKCC